MKCDEEFKMCNRQDNRTTSIRDKKKSKPVKGGKRKKLLFNILQAEQACNCFVLYYMLNANEQIYSKNDIYWSYDEINRIHFVV